MRILAVTNLYPSAESPASGVFIEQQVQGLRSRGIDVKVMFIDRRREGPWTYYRMRPQLRRCLVEFRPDLVHVMYGGVMAQEVTAERGLPPVCVTFHGSDLLGENLSGLWRKLISHYGVFCSIRAAQRAQGVVVVSRHLLNALGGRLNSRRVCVLPCGIDLNRFKPLDPTECRQQLNWGADDFHVLFASSAGDPVKRPELARAAVARFEQQRGPAQFHVLSGIPNDQVPIWLNAADVLLLTSQQEGSPTIVKEALACELPIVSVAVGDVPERIKDIPGCFLAAPDAGDLADKLSIVWQRGERLECREQLQELSCEAVAAKLEKFYKEITHERLEIEGRSYLEEKVAMSR
jgi:glycosyltransferase involved in cell wall biosynthesis